MAIYIYRYHTYLRNLYVWHVIRLRLYNTYLWRALLTYTSNTLMLSNNTHLWNLYCGTGWRRLIGSPNLQIIFHKRAIEYRSLLRKMTYKDKGSYESSPPCTTRALSTCIYHILLLTNFVMWRITGLFLSYYWALLTEKYRSGGDESRISQRRPRRLAPAKRAQWCVKRAQ